MLEQEERLVKWFHELENTSIQGKNAENFDHYLSDQELMLNPIGKTLACICYSRGVGGVHINLEKVYEILLTIDSHFAEIPYSLICGDLLSGVSMIFRRREIVEWFSQFLTHSDTLVMLADQILVKNPDQAFKSYEIAAEKGNIYAMSNLGDMFFFGEGSLECDQSEAIKWFKKAAEKDEPRALFALGNCFRDGIEVEKDEEKGLYYYKKSADAGFLKAISYLSGLYQKEKNMTDFVKYLRKGVEIGDASSIYNIGFANLGNFGVSENLPESFKYFMRAANLGHSLAQHKVGYALCNGIGIEKNSKEGVKWYLKAQKKEVASQYNLANAYYNGEGVEMNKETAFEWYLTAANNGHQMAKYYVGSSYYYGDGVNQDFHQAFKYLLMSAKHGYADAQFCVGTMYAQGLGVEKDSEQAIDFIVLAAEQGHDRAQLLLSSTSEQ